MISSSERHLLSQVAPTLSLKMIHGIIFVFAVRTAYGLTHSSSIPAISTLLVYMIRVEMA